MSQFDAHPNPAGRSQGYPYLVQLQSDVAATGSGEAIFAPLVPAALLKVADSVLLPRVQLAGVEYRVAVPMLRAVVKRRLAPPVGNVADSRWAILSAVDRLFTGG